ncbi:muconolactone Delta-isomerase family protein [Kribbella sp. NPDC050459]|uniref:muconolactone Delta-isomerase family protein n=1 Tax=Kribbella sp. NPDC050459 TaxID=3155785 RepID=UPI0033F5A545
MEFLVTMTTRVPDGVTEAEVAEVRAQEAAHSAGLAEQGRLKRLWRPPPAPGQWRTLGLFVADDPAALEVVLASMPLRIWRTDEVTELSAHPNDPGPDRIALDPGAGEFFTTFVLTVPSGATAADVDAMTAREARRTRELAAAGQLVRLWRLPGDGRNLGHWQTAEAELLRKIVDGLPMAPWLSVDTLPLTRHPSDPGTVAR